MSTLTHLTSDATVGDLPLHDFQVNADVPGQAIADRFEQEPTLPGVIVVADDLQLQGMISRRRFYKRLSEPYSLELFLKRPIQTFLNVGQQKQNSLLLPDDEKVNTAVRLALSRPAGELYEPIIVTFREETLPEYQIYLLLDLHTLFLAQTQILTSLNQELQQQRMAAQTHLENLEREKQKVQEYTNILESHQIAIQERNRLMEVQQSELLKQSREINQLNQRFLQIGRLLSSEGKKAFQATFTGVNVICQNTKKIVDIGHLLSEELDNIHATSQMIEHVSRQVRHLAVQAAIVAHRSGSEFSGFSHITNEISKLVSQTFEAGRQVERLASRFRLRIQELTESAEIGTDEARTLVQKIEQAEVALIELEDLVQYQQMGSLPVLPEAEADKQLEPAQMLVHKIAQAEATLSELKSLVERKDTLPIVRQIQRALDRRPE